MRITQYLVIIEKTNTGYNAYVPDLPGCISIGDSREEIERNIPEAIAFHQEGMKEDRLEIPIPTSEAVTVSFPKVA